MMSTERGETGVRLHGSAICCGIGAVVAHLFPMQKAMGSSPLCRRSCKFNPYGAVVTHLTCNEKIRGSNPRAGYTINFLLLKRRNMVDNGHVPTPLPVYLFPLFLGLIFPLIPIGNSQQTLPLYLFPLFLGLIFPLIPNDNSQQI